MIPFLLPAAATGIGALFGAAAPAAATAATGAGIGGLFASAAPWLLPAGMMAASVADRMMAPSVTDGPKEGYTKYKLNRKWDQKKGRFTGGYFDQGTGKGDFGGDVKMYAEGGPVVEEEMPSSQSSGAPQFDPMQAGIASLTQGGGQSATRQVDKQIVQQAFMALTGQIPKEQPLALFVQRFGKPALADLARRVVEMEGQNESGMQVSGPGDGVSDDIPAQAGSMPAKLSNGEFVVPARAVATLGNGSTDAGAKELHNMIRRLNHEGNNSTQAPRLEPAEYMPA